MDGVGVWYQAVGEGPPLVLLHGGMATNASWSEQFDGLARSRRIIAPERRAHGHTPDQPGPLTYQDMARETVGFLRALDLGPVDLVGWSDGGMIALLVAMEHPEAVRTLTTTGSGFSSQGYLPGSIEHLVALSADHQELASFKVDYEKVSPNGSAHFAVVWEKVRRMWAEPFDWSAQLGHVVAPTLVIVGDDDYVTVDHAAEFSRRVPRGQLAVIPGASHLAPIEKPDLFNRLVLDFTKDPTVHTALPLRRKAL